MGKGSASQSWFLDKSIKTSLLPLTQICNLYDIHSWYRSGIARTNQDSPGSQASDTHNRMFANSCHFLSTLRSTWNKKCLFVNRCEGPAASAVEVLLASTSADIHWQPLVPRQQSDWHLLSRLPCQHLFLVPSRQTHAWAPPAHLLVSQLLDSSSANQSSASSHSLLCSDRLPSFTSAHKQTQTPWTWMPNLSCKEIFFTSAYFVFSSARAWFRVTDTICLPFWNLWYRHTRLL